MISQFAALSGIIILHPLADFILQREKVAVGKHGLNLLMIEHLLFYHLGVLLPLALYFGLSFRLLVALALNLVSHWTIDAGRVYLKKIKPDYFENNFWSLLGLDQSLHFLTHTLVLFLV